LHQPAEKAGPCAGVACGAHRLQKTRFCCAAEPDRRELLAPPPNTATRPGLHPVVRNGFAALIRCRSHRPSSASACHHRSDAPRQGDRHGPGAGTVQPVLESTTSARYGHLVGRERNGIDHRPCAWLVSTVPRSRQCLQSRPTGHLLADWGAG
jgi:hypothetical protein